MTPIEMQDRGIYATMQEAARDYRDIKGRSLNDARKDLLGCKLLSPEANLPTKNYRGDLGYDLYALEDTVLEPGVVTKVRTGVCLVFPENIGALLRDRSSVATKTQVFVVAGVIDNSYTGEIIVAFYNPHTEAVQFKAKDKIAQMILTPVVNREIVQIEELPSTDRNDKGFGSTGR